MTAKKIALDIHGVIDTNPAFFRSLTWALFNNGWEVHVLTGSRLGNGRVEEWLNANEISYTHLFSISDHLSECNIPELPQSTPENPWFDDKIWNTVKANYCQVHKIPLCLDDNDAYFPHFTTPVARFYSKDKK